MSKSHATKTLETEEERPVRIGKTELVLIVIVLAVTFVCGSVSFAFMKPADASRNPTEVTRGR